MSNKPINKVEALTLTIRALVVVIVLLVILLAYSIQAVVNTPKKYTFWTPPDLTRGGFATLNAPEDIHVINFALALHAGIYTWKENGQKEFEENIVLRRHYLSKSYFSVLKSRSASKGSVYRNRERTLEFNYDEPSHRRIDSIGNNRWHLRLLIRTTDAVAGNEIKDEYIEYSYIVALVPTLRKDNPFGMKIVGEFAPSKRVTKSGA